MHNMKITTYLILDYEVSKLIYGTIIMLLTSIRIFLIIYSCINAKYTYICLDNG